MAQLLLLLLIRQKPYLCNLLTKRFSLTATPGAGTTTQHGPAQNTMEGENTSSQPTQILTTGPEQGERYIHWEYF